MRLVQLLSPLFRWGNLSPRGGKWHTQGHTARFTAGVGNRMLGMSSLCLLDYLLSFHSWWGQWELEDRLHDWDDLRALSCHTPALPSPSTTLISRVQWWRGLGNTKPGEREPLRVDWTGKLKGTWGPPRTKRKPGLLDGKETPLRKGFMC